MKPTEDEQIIESLKMVAVNYPELAEVVAHASKRVAKVGYWESRCRILLAQMVKDKVRVKTA